MCEPLIDAKAAAVIIDSCPKTVKQMAARNQLPAIRIGNRWKFRASALDEWLKSELTSVRHPLPMKGKHQ